MNMLGAIIIIFVIFVVATIFTFNTNKESEIPSAILWGAYMISVTIITINMT